MEPRGMITQPTERILTMGQPDSPLILPNDEYNQQLVGNVHPSNWVNPEPTGRYNIVVIGAGTAGLVTAVIAAGFGAKVALVERHLMGGDCLNVGCVPSKALTRAVVHIEFDPLIFPAEYSPRLESPGPSGGRPEPACGVWLTGTHRRTLPSSRPFAQWLRHPSHSYSRTIPRHSHACHKVR